jgi:muramoyltetrapeptide carboxypeptidase
MFADPSVDAIFAIRGGYGAAQLLDRIDYDLLRKSPKIFLGYSDITAMHLAIQKRAGLVTFHGPVACTA